jgi:hypothetical protein
MFREFLSMYQAYFNQVREKHSKNFL